MADFYFADGKIEVHRDPPWGVNIWRISTAERPGSGWLCDRLYDPLFRIWRLEFGRQPNGDWYQYSPVHFDPGVRIKQLLEQRRDLWGALLDTVHGQIPGTRPPAILWDPRWTDIRFGKDGD